MKVLFDSNIFVSAGAYSGAALKGINGTLELDWRLLACPTVISETRRILRRTFKLPKSRVERFMSHVDRVATVVPEPLSRHIVPGDDDDSPILRAAVGAGADYLVTRDAKILALGRVDSTRIITLAAYLELLRGEGAQV